MITQVFKITENKGKDGHSHIHSKSVVSSFSDDGKGKPKEIVIGKEYENDSDKNVFNLIINRIKNLKNWCQLMKMMEMENLKE